MVLVLSGSEISQRLLTDYAKRVALLPRPPHLAVILVGSHPASNTYVAMKTRACQRTGILSSLHTFSESLSQQELLEHITLLNADPAVDGILVQLPLPPHIDVFAVMEYIDPTKDVDGFHPQNLGKLLSGQSDGFVPCTPLGIQVLLKEYHLDPAGQHVVIVGRSAIVGKPLAALLMQKAAGGNATVTVAHSHSHNLFTLTRSADIVVTALGSPHFLSHEAIRPGAIVIDVGITRVAGRLIGDVNYAEVAPHCHAITPVPGGIGPMTVAMLLHNTYLSSLRRQSEFRKKSIF